jgi:predicted TIM-barrel fold metal-dependent hydrolase
MKVIDAHLHNWDEYRDYDHLMRCLDRFQVDHGVLLSPLLGGFCPNEAQLDESNRLTLQFVRQAKGRLSGFCYVNPQHSPHALDALRRGLDAGLIGLKLWVATFCDDARVFPLVEEVSARGLPTLVHTWIKHTGNLEHESTPAHCARLAGRYPRAKFIMAHFGGDWEIGLKTIRHLPNVCADYAGTPNEAGAYEMAVRELGEDRVIFGSDGPGGIYLVNYGRVLEADIPESARGKILAGNFLNLLPAPLRPKL